MVTQPRKSARSFLGVGLVLLVSLVAALVVTHPVTGVFVVVALVLGIVLLRIVALPWRGLPFCVWMFPIYPTLKSIAFLATPSGVAGIRFWREGILAAIFVGVFVRAIVYRRRLAVYGDDFPALLYLLMCAYGIVLSLATQHPSFAIFGFHYVGVPVLFYFAARFCQPTSSQRRGLVRAFVASYMVLLAVSLPTYFWRPAWFLQLAEAARPEVSSLALRIDSSFHSALEYWIKYERMQSLLFEENFWGTLCSFVSLLALSRLVHQRTGIARWWGVWFLSTLCLVLSLSRGSWIGWCVGVAVLLVLWRRYSWRLSVALLVAVTVLGGALQIYADDPRVVFALQRNQDAGVGTDSFASDRVHQWRQGWDIFERNPSGKGIGTVAIAASHTRRAMTLVADSTYIASLAEVGIPGMLCLAGSVVGIVWVILRYQRSVTDPGVLSLGTALVAHLAGMLVHGITANMLEYAYVMPMFWLLFAVFVLGAEAETTDNHMPPVLDTVEAHG
jgi:O-antigen ligase